MGRDDCEYVHILLGGESADRGLGINIFCVRGKGGGEDGGMWMRGVGRGEGGGRGFFSFFFVEKRERSSFRQSRPKKDQT